MTRVAAKSVQTWDIRIFWVEAVGLETSCNDYLYMLTPLVPIAVYSLNKRPWTKGTPKWPVACVCQNMNLHVVP